MDEKIGLVLSGGGVRAIAHIGLIKVLLENGITPTQVSGTSAGAVVAALYAAGFEIEEMLTFFEQTPLLKISLYAYGKTGILDSEKYIPFFDKYFPNDSFESLKYPITVTATNLMSGKLEYFNKGELIKPLIASSALPPVFSPIEMNGFFYADGGVLNNFPVEPLIKDCTKIIGSFVTPLAEIDKSEINTSIKLLYRVYHLGLNANNIIKFKDCNYVFLPKQLANIGVLDTSSIKKAFKIGEEEAKKNLSEIKDSIA